MKKIISNLLVSIVGITFFLGTPVFAACSEEQLEKGCVNTSILGEGGCSCKNGEFAEKGEGVRNILNLILDIMSIGIGILGVIGVSIVGIQYLTAGPNEEKTRKAKRRMFEIVLGLAAYAVMYATLKWLGIDPSAGTPP